MVHSDFIFIDESGSKFSTSVKNRQGRVPLSGQCFKQIFLNGTDILPSSVIVRKDIIDHVGLFDETFLRAQDYDLWLRISYRYPVSFINEPLVKYRIHNNNFTKQTMMGEIHSARALVKAAENVPDIEKIIGKSALRRRLYQACFDVAYRALIADEFDTGRYWLKKAWRWGRRPKSLFLLVTTACLWPLVGKYYGRKKVRSIS